MKEGASGIEIRRERNDQSRAASQLLSEFSYVPFIISRATEREREKERERAQTEG